MVRAGAELLRYNKARDAYTARLYHQSKEIQLWLGKLSRQQQLEWELHLRALVDNVRAGTTIPPAATAFFGRSSSAIIREELIRSGLPASEAKRHPEQEQLTIAGYCDLFIQELKSSPITTNNYSQARDWLLRSVDSSEMLGSVTTG